MEKILRNEPIRNKKCLWWPCLLTDQDEMSNLYREPSIDASYQDSVHLNKCFRRRFLKIGQSETRIACVAMFVNRSGQNQPVWPCLLIDQDKISNLQRGPSIDASYQVSVHLAKRFQRRRLKWEKLTDDGRQVMAKAHIAFGKVS